jgi:hypothetical protein
VRITVNLQNLRSNHAIDNRATATVFLLAGDPPVKPQ